MIELIEVTKKGNGVLLEGVDGDPEIPNKEIVLEDGPPGFETRIGRAILDMFKKPRKSPVKKGATE